MSDFLSECWSRLRDGGRLAAMQNRVHLGGALSGRDFEGVDKTVSALIKLLFPDPEMEIPEEDLEWTVRLELESRRRVKEQQKRCLKSEFRNTHFSYSLGLDGVETFVATPERHSDDAIDEDPLPPGQVWAIVTPGGMSFPSNSGSWTTTAVELAWACRCWAWREACSNAIRAAAPSLSARSTWAALWR